MAVWATSARRLFCQPAGEGLGKSIIHIRHLITRQADAAQSAQHTFCRAVTPQRSCCSATSSLRHLAAALNAACLHHCKATLHCTAHHHKLTTYCPATYLSSTTPTTPTTPAAPPPVQDGSQ
jgi:hypothetical protein